MGLHTEWVERVTEGSKNTDTIHLKRIARRVDGNLVRLLNRLGATGDPNLPMGVSELFDFRLRGKLSGQAPVLHVGRGQQQLRLTPLDTNSVNGQVFGENGYLYREAWPNVDLRLEVGGHIIRKTMPLRTGHPSRFQFRLDSFANFDPLTLSGPEFRIVNPSLDGPNGQHIPLVWAVSEIGGHQVLTVELPTGDWAGWVVDPTVVIQPDATDGLDNTIRSDYPDRNYGIQSNILAGQGGGETWKAMLLMSLATVLGVITSADLTLTILAIGGSASGDTLAAHQALTQWYEGAKNGTTPDAGQDGSTWSYRNYNGSVAWGAAGGQSGTDYAAGNMGTVAYSSGDTGTKTISLDAATVEAQRTGTNFGLWLLGGSGVGHYIQVESSDSATAANRPKLVVEYTEAGGLSIPVAMHHYRQLRRAC